MHIEQVIISVDSMGHVTEGFRVCPTVGALNLLIWLMQLALHTDTSSLGLVK